ncbi:MAG: phosphatase PAP2 family protein, partial [Reyranella sp.]
ANLLEAMEFRTKVLAEALSQKDSFMAHFRGAMSFSKATHPNTVYLLQGALRISQFVAMYYKDIFQRPRPSQLWPELMPPIVVPGHASFPSGHATEAYFVARWLELIAGPAGANVVPSATNSTTAADSPGPPARLAQRIARNREVLGLHYPSDSAAGRMIADELIKKITGSFGSYPTGSFGSYPKLEALFDAARVEWAEFT